MCVRHYAAKGYGPGKIRNEFYRRGIPKELWDDALLSMPEQDDQIDRLLRKKLRSPAPDRDELRKAANFLYRRGFHHDEIQAANLKMVSCNMVKRAMSSSASDAFGVTNATATMGPFSQQVAYANPSGDMYVSKSERAILGIGTATIGSIRAHTDIRTVRHARR